MTDKGRLSIPARFRDVCRGKYGEDAFIVTNFDRCLIAYPLKEWHEMEKKVLELPQFKQEVISFSRYLIGNAVDCPLDGQGRILIPQPLRSHARISRSVTMIGMLNKIEIWSKEIWDEEQSEKDYAEFMNSRELLTELGL